MTVLAHAGPAFDGLLAPVSDGPVGQFLKALQCPWFMLGPCFCWFWTLLYNLIPFVSYVHSHIHFFLLRQKEGHGMHPIFFLSMSTLAVAVEVQRLLNLRSHSTLLTGKCNILNRIVRGGS